jgi:hypothetical protein
LQEDSCNAVVMLTPKGTDIFKVQPCRVYFKKQIINHKYSFIMKELILLFSSKYFVKQESDSKLSIITHDKLNNVWANSYNLKITETHLFQNKLYQYVLELK